MNTVIAFAGNRRLASGALADVAAGARRALDAGEAAPLLIFDAVTSRPVEVDLRGTEAEVRARLAPRPEMAEDQPGPRRGRPKLGVTAREVTLLPRHWDWLAGQRGGASVTLRRLVEEARRANPGADALREGQEALYRFTTAMAGDAPGYEEATRALFAGDRERFEAETQTWPADVRAHALTLAAAAFVPAMERVP
jgi:hypothetical protein